MKGRTRLIFGSKPEVPQALTVRNLPSYISDNYAQVSIFAITGNETYPPL